MLKAYHQRAMVWLTFQKVQALLNLLLESLQLLSRSILGTSRRTITKICDPMVLIPGYWDPQAHHFIEEPESEIELGELVLRTDPEVSNSPEVARAPRKSHAGAASVAGARTANASCKTKTC